MPGFFDADGIARVRISKIGRITAQKHIACFPYIENHDPILLQAGCLAEKLLATFDGLARSLVTLCHMRGCGHFRQTLRAQRFDQESAILGRRIAQKAKADTERRRIPEHGLFH